MESTIHQQAVPVALATPEIRTAYLRRVTTITMLGLAIAAAVGLLSTFLLAQNPTLLTGYFPMIIILGCWGVTNFVAPKMVFGSSKWAGFVLGTVTQGIALGFILLVGILLSQQRFGNPFNLIGTALGITVCVGLGLAIYAAAERREFSLLRAGLAATFIPMLVLMAVSFAFPNLFSGTFGVVICGVFVLISAAGLLYQLNNVIHNFSSDMHIEGAYTVAIGVLVLFWNILSLLSRITRR
jgi:FtsH-binding integral membrane protein